MSAKNNSSRQKRYIFGPVPSRRLGLSLGVDIVPFKVCPLDCVYCQLGRTTTATIQRQEYVPINDVLEELKSRLSEGINPDYISLSGSGEPTLNISIAKLISGIKKITKIPVAILTNGVLFNDPDVRRQCLEADVVLPSLDAADEKTFSKINRPYPGISIENVISGLEAFRKEFKNQVWLEIFIVESFNTSPEQLANIRSGIKRIKPDKVQINTAVRPTADINIEKVDYKRLKEIASQLGENCEIVADYEYSRKGEHVSGNEEKILTTLSRRPCSLEDICASLGLHRNEAEKYLAILIQGGLIEKSQKDGAVFFKVR
ncbi:MAG: radical SAM protein [Phycisphaerae bacterium]